VTKDVTKAVKDAKAGHTKFRMDKTSILHVPLGKVTSLPKDLKFTWISLTSFLIKTTFQKTSTRWAFLKRLYERMLVRLWTPFC